MKRPGGTRSKANDPSSAVIDRAAHLQGLSVEGHARAPQRTGLGIVGDDDPGDRARRNGRGRTGIARRRLRLRDEYRQQHRDHWRTSRTLEIDRLVLAFEDRDGRRDPCERLEHGGSRQSPAGSSCTATM